MPTASNELVDQKFQESFVKIADSYETTKQRMADLQGYIQGMNLIDLTPVFNAPDFVRYILPTGVKPNAPTITFPDFTIPDVDTPIPNFQYTDSPYASELRETLKTELIDGIENGGTGLGPEVEDAIFERDRLRREQALRDAQDRIATDWGGDEAGDLGLPDGALAAQYIAANTEHLQKEQTVSYDTATKMAELARQQQEVYLKEGNQLEATMESKHTADQARALEAAKTEPEIVIRTFEAAMMKVKVFAEIYTALAAKADAQARVFDSAMKGYMADVEVGEKEIMASATIYDSSIKGATAQSEAYYRTDANKIEQAKNYFSLGTEALKSLAALASQICAAFATSVSASASLGVQASSSDSTSTSNITQHYYEHKDDREFL